MPSVHYHARTAHATPCAQRARHANPSCAACAACCLPTVVHVLPPDLLPKPRALVIELRDALLQIPNLGRKGRGGAEQRGCESPCEGAAACSTPALVSTRSSLPGALQPPPDRVQLVSCRHRRKGAFLVGCGGAAKRRCVRRTALRARARRTWPLVVIGFTMASSSDTRGTTRRLPAAVGAREAARLLWPLGRWRTPAAGARVCVCMLSG
jgi:hypothetical protein